MKLVFSVIFTLVVCFGCTPSPQTTNTEGVMQEKEFTAADACKALLRDLKIPVDSDLGKALTTEQYTKEPYSGDYIIESKSGQLSFNLKEKEFRIVRGIEPKTGAPHVSRGEFYVSESGELKAHYPALSK